ncbi:endogenous retrovirus group S71 member 1 Env polyprotein-like [Tenrec ecaudatus]|uniref:endogenous retrovirus group S71 member 1 Env polyprotein-like n=1 Tax=Tenrec ecaudatus TaxID=94439 RepID=UPI003F593516
MACHLHLKRLKIQAYLLLVLSTLGHCSRARAPDNPHHLQTHRWTLVRTLDGTTVASYDTSTQPTFRLDLCTLLGPHWGDAFQPGYAPGGRLSGGKIPWQKSYGCGRIQLELGLQATQCYACPREGPEECGGEEDYYCASWSCVTAAPWQNTDPLIHVSRGTGAKQCQVGRCNPVHIFVKTWWEPYWIGGKTWGLRLYVTGFDPGTEFTIQKRVLPAPQNPIGPLRNVIAPRPKPLVPTHTHSPSVPPTQRVPGKIVPKGSPRPNSETSTWAPKLVEADDPHPSATLNTLTAMFSFLNHSNPNLTADCWLCLNSEAPFYVGIATNASIGDADSNIRNVSTRREEDTKPATTCPWGTEPKLTLGDITGQGLCLTSDQYQWTASPYQDVCTSTIIIPSDAIRSPAWLIWLMAPPGTWWACTNGITPCAFPPILAQDPPELCVLIHILPQVYYYTGEGGREHLGITPHRQKRTPVLIPVLLGLGVAGSAAVGTVALIKNMYFDELSRRIDEDLSTLEDSVSTLERSLNSLADVVVQNRRGLDLLFLKQGGLCMALGETCCFYANHSGIIKENLSQLRKRIKEREETRYSQGNWYQNLFNWSPWLTNLISAVAGPVLLLLLALTVGPCVLRALVSLIQKAISGFKNPG